MHIVAGNQPIPNTRSEPLRRRNSKGTEAVPVGIFGSRREEAHLCREHDVAYCSVARLSSAMT